MLRRTAFGQPQSCQRKTGRYKDSHLYQITSHTAGASAEREEEAAGVDQSYHSILTYLHTYLRSNTSILKIFITTIHSHNHDTLPSAGNTFFYDLMLCGAQGPALLLLSSHTECDMGGTTVTDLGLREGNNGLGDRPWSTGSALLQYACGCFWSFWTEHMGREGQAHYSAPRYHICLF